MPSKHMPTRRMIAGAAISLAIAAMPAAAAAKPGDAATVRAGTAGYHDIDAARADGYGELRDAQGIACIDQPGSGAMGIHYVRGDLLGDAVVSAATPEALVYEPTRNGRLRLVAAEYIVFQSAWDATHSEPPSLFGRRFELLESPNRYGAPSFYELHAWVWKHNPSGMFDDWNPRVTCAFG